jgi:hypothetical protein
MRSRPKRYHSNLQFATCNRQAGKAVLATVSAEVMPQNRMEKDMKRMRGYPGHGHFKNRKGNSMAFDFHATKADAKTVSDPCF